jgi:hypothetical protein
MKRLVLLITAICFFGHLQAQDAPCDPMQGLTPDQVVVPEPFIDPETTPNGGIFDTACINQPFEFVVTLNPPEEFNGNPIASLTINPEGSISGLPTGLDYVCNPPNCEFAADTVGCILISGTPTDIADIGSNSLLISGFIVFESGSLFPISFPNILIAPGDYFLFVKEEGSENCWVPTGTNELVDFVSMTNRPNPFSDWTTIEINSDLVGTYQFTVSDVMGRNLYQQPVDIVEGQNLIEFDGSQLANGIYVYSLSDGRNMISKRMVVNK